MKVLKYFLSICLATIVVAGCEPELDPITQVNPGSDTEDPTLEINYPVAGKVVRVTQDQTFVNLTVTATDDIELKSVIFILDSVPVDTAKNFKDYRRAIVSYKAENLADGNHSLSVIATDLTGKTVTKFMEFTKVTATPYTPLDGEKIFFAFEDNLKNQITGTDATAVGSPGFTSGKIGDAYAGKADSYITYPAIDLTSSSEFAVAFWYKINANPKRGGIISMSAEGDNNRTSGFRMAHEDSGTQQNLFVNYGIDSTEVWMNPFVKISTTEDWIHIAVSITDTLATVYVNGEVSLTTVVTHGIDWTGVTSITIGSGEPNFVYWLHFSDQSLIDEMHFFNRALTVDEVQMLYGLTK